MDVLCYLCIGYFVLDQHVANPFHYLYLPKIRDEWGNQIWICPGCNKPDDGSPMIGCDDCDDWYHW